MFYGLQLLSATRVFRVDCLVKLIGVSLEEGCDQLVDGRVERCRAAEGSPTVGLP